MKRRSVLAATLVAAAAVLQGCAAPGAPFVHLEPVEPGKGNLYVDRESALYAKGLLLGWGLLSDSAARTQGQAVADLKALDRAN